MADIAGTAQKIGERARTRSFGDPNRDGYPNFAATVPQMFEKYLQLPEPGIYDSHIASLHQALNHLRVRGATNRLNFGESLEVAKDEFEQLADTSTLDSWHGPAARLFKHFFQIPFPTYTENNFVLIAPLKGALEAHHAVYRTAHDDLEKIQATIEAALVGEYAPVANPVAVTVAFTIIGSIGTVASLGTGGLAAAIGAAATIAGSTKGLVDDPQKYTHNNTTLEIINTMERMLVDLDSRITQGIDRIGDTLNELISSVAQISQNDRAFVAPRPNISPRTLGDPNQP